jgi:hypothetical protein
MKRILVFFLCVGVGFGMLWAEGGKLSRYDRATLNWVEEMVIDVDSVPEPHLLVNPFAVTEDADGNIYVTDAGAHNVKKFKPDGSFIAVFGRQGAGPGDLNYPGAIAFADGKLVISDIMNRRFSIFSTDGKFVDSVRIESSNEMCKTLRSAANGLLAVEFLKMNRKPKEPQQVTIRASQGAKLSDKSNVIFERNVHLRSFITKPAPTNIIAPFPATVCWDTLPDGKIAAGFSETYEIGVYDPQKGKIATLSRKHKQIPIEDTDKKAFFKTLRFFENGKVTNNIPDHVRENTTFPKFKPAFEAIFADSQGYILVFPFQKATDKKDRRQVDVFRADGKFVRAITLVGKVNIYALSRGNGDYFWGRKTNEDEEAAIVKYCLK